MREAHCTANYARNLAELGQWGLLPDRPSNTATSPLNVWLLAAATVVLDRPVLAIGAVLVVALTAAAWWADGLRRDLDVARALPYLVVALLACSPLLAGAATSVVFLLIWPWDLPPISTNWGTSGQYASMGTEVARLTGDEPVATSWEIGTPVFFCRCPLLDWFGDRAAPTSSSRSGSPWPAR